MLCALQISAPQGLLTNRDLQEEEQEKLRKPHLHALVGCCPPSTQRSMNELKWETCVPT